MPTIADNLAFILTVPLLFLSSFALLALLVQLARRGLLRAHWPLAAYAMVEGLSGPLTFLSTPTKLPLLFRASEILKLVFAVMVIWSLSRTLFSSYPAIGSFASRAAKLIVAGCLLLGWISFLTDPILPLGRSPALHLFISVERAVITGLLAFLFILSVFVGWFPVRMARNLARILIGFLAILTAAWINHLVSNVASRYTPWGNILSSIMLVGSAVYWSLTVHLAGETETAYTLPAWDPERMDRMTSQLAQMEAQLSRRGH